MGDLRAEFLEAIGVLPVAARLARLQLDAPQPAVDFVDDVGEAEEILLDALQPPQGFDLSRLEAADARRFLEDHAAVLCRRLEEYVDLSLFNDAVGLGAQTGAGEEIANVTEAAGLAVDQVLPFATAVHAPRDVHFGRVDGENTGRIIERERDFGGIHRPACAGTVEDHVGHFLAAEALDALFAEYPLDGVDNIRLARAVRPDDDGDSRGELEPRLVGEALETEEFQGLEHGAAWGETSLTVTAAGLAMPCLVNGWHGRPQRPGFGPPVRRPGDRVTQGSIGEALH